jgi:hypothetical protein
MQLGSTAQVKIKGHCSPRARLKNPFAPNHLPSGTQSEFSTPMLNHYQGEHPASDHYLPHELLR